MKANFLSLFWGIVLIIFGGFALANQTGYLADLSIPVWIVIFAAASALFLVAYFFNGVRVWGWLFPTCIFAALSATMLLTYLHIASQWIPTLIVGSLAIPFIAAFVIDRSRIWALLPAFILSLIAFIPPLDQVLGDDNLGAFLVAVIGLSFIAAYLNTPKAWWGIVPGGILLSISLMISIVNIINSETAVAIMFTGWMLTFGLAWQRRSLHAADWAKYPAIVMGILASIMFLIAIGLETFWYLGLILAGLALIIISVRPRKTAALG